MVIGFRSWHEAAKSAVKETSAGAMMQEAVAASAHLEKPASLVTLECSLHAVSHTLPVVHEPHWSAQPERAATAAMAQSQLRPGTTDSNPSRLTSIGLTKLAQVLLHGCCLLQNCKSLRPFAHPGQTVGWNFVATGPAASTNTEDASFLCMLLVPVYAASQSTGEKAWQASVLVDRLMAKLKQVALMHSSLATIEFLLVDQCAISTCIYKVISAGQRLYLPTGDLAQHQRPTFDAQSLIGAV